MPINYGLRATTVLSILDAFTYNHDVNVREATRALRVIESYRGKIDKRDIKSCNNYAINILGNQHFAPWLYVYVALSREFKEGWMPDNYYGSVVVPKVKGRYGMLADHEGLNAAILQSDGFPDMPAYANGIFFDAK